MKQLAQKLKTGKVSIIEVPVPEMGNGDVLVRNIYSCVSAGTESSTVKTARKGYIGKAKERPAQLKQVIDTLKTQGPVQTYRAVMKKLEAHSPLGYSCIGRVIDVGVGVKDIAIGDFVACGGSTAIHAEIVSVPFNLCVRVSPEVDFKQASYNTIGAIAMQGVRQADVRLGECCAVIGLGLIGQLTCNLLKAAGVKVVGIDLDAKMAKMAGDNCADLIFFANDISVEKRIIEFSNGMGCDAVIITAASSSNDPINFAGAIARKKGTVVVVGAVPTGFDREPHYYNKELSVKMSCSYGPGRYDPEYEEKGNDYPYAYVRWTERRNMQAFQDMIASKRIDLEYLTTHVFKLEKADTIYDMVIERSEPFAGILIEYDQAKDIQRDRVLIGVPKHRKTRDNGQVSIGFLGAGSYAQGYLLPNIPKSNDVLLKGVVTRSSAGSRSVADRFGFEFCSSNPDDILNNDEINTVFIASRHNSHGKYVIQALKSGKNVFVEKPLCIKVEELAEIKDLIEKTSNSEHQPIVMVGFNRRFSPFSEILKNRFEKGPMAMTYRVNAGFIPPESWIQDPEVGGGRILGEVCHFIDYMTFIIGSLPKSVSGAAMRTSGNLNDTISLVLRYENGAIGNINYFANGSKALTKEHIEIYQDGTTAVIDDFKSLMIYGGAKPFKRNLLTQNKGQESEVKLFIDAVRRGSDSPISFREIHSTSLACFDAIEAIRSGNSISM